MALLGRGAKPWILEASGPHGTRGKLIDCHAAPMSAVSIECSCLISLVETESIALRPHSHGHDAAQRMTKARLGASCHAHEWQLFREREAARRQDSHPGRLGAEVEFYRAPERVAQRIGRYAALVGRENVSRAQAAAMARG